MNGDDGNQIIIVVLVLFCWFWMVVCLYFLIFGETSASTQIPLKQREYMYALVFLKVDVLDPQKVCGGK